MKIKFQLNYKNVIFLLILFTVGVICFGLDYCLYKPTKINAYIASNLYKAPANSAFTDDNFSKCVVDAYNSKNKTK